MSRTITLTDSQKSLVNTLPQQYINLNLGDTCNVVLAYILSKAQDNIAMLTNGDFINGTGFGSKNTITKSLDKLISNGILVRTIGKKGCPSRYKFNGLPNIVMVSNEEIMENTGIGSKHTLAKALRQLDEKSIITCTRYSRNRPTMYTVHPNETNSNAVEAKKDTDTPPHINYSQLYELSKMGDGLPLNIFVELMHMISINPKKKFLTYSQIAQFTGRKLRTIALYIPYLKEQGYIPSEWMDRIGEKH